MTVFADIVNASSATIEKHESIIRANLILVKRGSCMKEKFSYDEYLDLIEKDEGQANKYKSKFIPNQLYKYQPIGSGTMRTKRIQTIKKEEIWASRVKYLNDPFEFKMLYANQDSDDIREFYEDVLNRNEIICLSGKWNDKLMWAHYADSHTGMCVEYTFRDNHKGQVNPVTYVANRQNCDNELKTWLENKDRALEAMLKQKRMDGIQRRQLHASGKIMYTKDSVWKYEKEYRIVTRNHKDIESDMFDSYKNQKGSLHKIQEFNFNISKVYLGMNCTEENRNKIIETIKVLNDIRVREAIGHSRKDKAIMYKVLEDMGMIATVWQVYSDDKLKLRCKQIS